MLSSPRADHVPFLGTPISRLAPLPSSPGGRSCSVKCGPLLLESVAVLLQVRATERVDEVKISNRIREAKITGPGLPWRYNTGMRARRLVAALLTVLMLSVSTWASGGTIPCAPTRRCLCCKTNSIASPKPSRIAASRQGYSPCGCALQQQDQESAEISAIRVVSQSRSTDHVTVAVGIAATSKPSSRTVRIGKGAPPPGINVVEPLFLSLRI